MRKERPGSRATQSNKPRPVVFYESGGCEGERAVKRLVDAGPRALWKVCHVLLCSVELHIRAPR